MNTIALTENVLRIRKDFSKIPSILEIPNLIEIQKQTFERFLQAGPDGLLTVLPLPLVLRDSTKVSLPESV